MGQSVLDEEMVNIERWCRMWRLNGKLVRGTRIANDSSEYVIATVAVGEPIQGKTGELACAVGLRSGNRWCRPTGVRWWGGP